MKQLLDTDIAIIGGGWYGCHLAITLQKLGANVVLFERKLELMEGASGYNSFRLHLGPHYPRCKETRDQVKESFHRFCATYPDFVINQNKALYAIGEEDCDGLASLVDVQEFLQICGECDPMFSVEDSEEHNVKNVRVLCDVNEKTVCVDGPPQYFKKQLSTLGVDVMLGCSATNINTLESQKVLIHFKNRKQNELCKEFHWCLNCTYYKDFQSSVYSNVFYEPCLSLYYETNRDELKEKLFSLSIFDGNFPALDPYVTRRHGNEHILYLLTHAKYTPLARFENVEDAERYIANISVKEIEKRSRLMEEDFSRFYPTFKDDFQYSHFFLSTKTKLKSENEFRGTLVWKENKQNLIHVFSGKLSTIFQAQDQVEYILRKWKSSY